MANCGRRAICQMPVATAICEKIFLNYMEQGISTVNISLVAEKLLRLPCLR